jgi:hypothetical protein
MTMIDLSDVEPIALGEWPGHLSNRYERLALITDERHLAHLDDADTTTLIISSSWLLWQMLARKGRHCVYLEQGFSEEASADALSQDILLRANDWVYVNGADATLFDQVSLGRGFSTEIAFFLSTWFRVENALTHLIERFQPKTIIYFDLVLIDTESTRNWARLYVVEKVTAARGLAFENRADPVDFHDQAIGNAGLRGFIASAARKALLSLYLVGVDAIASLLSRLSRHDVRALLMVSWNVIGPITIGQRSGVQLVVHARAYPKSPSMMLRLIRHGFLLARPAQPKLNAAEAARVEAVAARLTGEWRKNPEHSIAEGLREYVRREIISTGRLVEMAREAKAAKQFLRRFNPDRLVVDGVKNPPHYVYVECCAASGIPIDYIWHSPLAPQNLKLDALGCDPRIECQVSRFLSWGEVNELWLRRIGATVPETVRVGNPILSKYNGRRGRSAYQSADPAHRRALVVQHTTVLSDLKGLLSHQYYQFVHAVRELTRLGYGTVVVKLHPGMQRGCEIYEAIGRVFGLKCDIRRYGSFERFVNEADVVVGPLVSGSALEVASSGSDFLAFFLSPTTFDENYYRGIANIHRDLADLGSALAERRFLDCQQYLDLFGATMTAEERAAAFWSALRA